MITDGDIRISRFLLRRDTAFHLQSIIPADPESTPARSTLSRHRIITSSYFPGFCPGTIFF
jgi:hypothetical protein